MKILCEKTNCMTESILQQEIIKQAKKRGILALKVEAVGRRGLPDLLLIYNGKTVHAEIKHPNGRGRLSALQVHMIALLKDHGAQVHVINSLDEAVAMLESML
jgi:hypothetical protein